MKDVVECSLCDLEVTTRSSGDEFAMTYRHEQTAID